MPGEGLLLVEESGRFNTVTRHEIGTLICNNHD